MGIENHQHEAEANRKAITPDVLKDYEAGQKKAAEVRKNEAQTTEDLPNFDEAFGGEPETKEDPAEAEKPTAPDTPARDPHFTEVADATLVLPFTKKESAVVSADVAALQDRKAHASIGELYGDGTTPTGLLAGLATASAYDAC